MHLVIGGAYQGKKEYVKKKYSIKESDIWQGGFPIAEGEWRCIDGLHKIIRDMMINQMNKAHQNPQATYPYQAILSRHQICMHSGCKR